MYTRSGSSDTWAKAGNVSAWTISSNLGMLDATTLGDTDRVSTPGVRTTTGSCQLFYHQETAGDNTGNTASTLIDTLVKARTAAAVPGVAAEPETVQLRLQIDDGTSLGKYITVEANLTSASMMCAVGAVFSAALSFEVNGAPIAVNM